jgi:hypothetical protein
LAEFQQVLAVQLRVLGADHPDTLPTRQAIAATLAAQGRTAEASSEFEHVLAAQLRVLGGDHPDTLTTLAALRWLKSLRRDGRSSP